MIISLDLIGSKINARGKFATIVVPTCKRATGRKYGTRLLLPVCFFVYFRSKSSNKPNHLIVPFFQVLLDVFIET